MNRQIVQIIFGSIFWCMSISHTVWAQTRIGAPGAPTSTLDVKGSFAATYNNITATTYAMTITDYYLAWNGAAAGTVTLPAATIAAPTQGNIQGRVYHIKNTSNNQTLTVAAAGAELLDNQSGAGVANITLPAGYYAMLISKGTTTGTTWEVALIGNNNSAPCQGFGARFTGGTQALPNNVGTKILFPSEEWDEGGVFTPATGNFTVTQTGKYVITAMAFINSAGVSTAQAISLYKNGALLVQGNNQRAGATDGNGQVVTYIASLAAGDVIDVRVIMIGGSSTILAASFSAIKTDCSSVATATSGVPDYDWLRTSDGQVPSAVGDNAVSIYHTGNVGIGTATPVSHLSVVSDGQGGANADDLEIASYNNSPGAAFYFKAATGTQAAPGNLNNGSLLGGIFWQGRRNNSNTDMSIIRSSYLGDGTTSLSDMRFSTSATERMRIDENGNVGIGTTTPTAHLDVLGGYVKATNENTFGGFNGYTASSTATHGPLLLFQRARGTVAAPTFPQNGDILGQVLFRNHLVGTGISIYGLATETHSAAATGTALAFTTTPNGTVSEANRMYINHNGNVGIGTTVPDYPLHVQVAGAGGVHASSQRIIASNIAGPIWTQNTSSSGSIGIFSNFWICTDAGFVAHSDARIKNIVGISNSALDLNTLNKIQITDYTKIDAVEDNRPYKKVIAQQIESVYPQAVMNSTDYIPNVYETAQTIKTAAGITTLTTVKAHDFKTGDKVRLETAEKGQAFFIVTVLDAHTFTVSHDFGTDKVFVYGKQVADFKSVDYEAIAMLNVSATQELAKQLKEAKAEIETLKKQNATLTTSTVSRAEYEELKALVTQLLEQKNAATTTTTGDEKRK